MLLGAVELSPLEVAQMYHTIANAGFRVPLRAIREVTTQSGRPLKRYSLEVKQAFPVEPTYLLTAAMQGVVREGTARSLASWLPPESARALLFQMLYTSLSIVTAGYATAWIGRCAAAASGGTRRSRQTAAA